MHDQGVVGYYLPANANVHAANPALNAQVNLSYIQYDTIDFDTIGFAVGAPPFDRLIVPAEYDGTYIISTQLDTSSSANGAVQGLIIYVNGTINIGQSKVQQQGTGGGSLNVGTIWRLNVGDYIQVQYQDTAGSASQHFLIDEPGTPSLSLARVGP